MKNIMIIAVALLFVLGGMGGGFFMLWSKISAMEQTAAPAADIEESEASEPRPIYNLATLIVNLADTDGRRYLRSTMDVELRKPEDEQKILARLPQVKDAAIKVMSTRNFDDINSIAGKNALKDELVVKFNEVLKSESITNIYFSEFVVQ